AGLGSVGGSRGRVGSLGLSAGAEPPMKPFGEAPLITRAVYLAIDPAQFMPGDEFRRRIDRLVEMVKSSKLARGVDEVFLAGEIEFRRRADRLRDGIPLSQVVFQELQALAAESGVAFDLG